MNQRSLGFNNQFFNTIGAKRPLVLPRDSVTIKSGRSVQLGRTNEGKQTQAFGGRRCIGPD
jgi:hypothetical protein